MTTFRPDNIDNDNDRLALGAHVHHCPTCNFDWTCLYDASSPCIFDRSNCDGCEYHLEDEYGDAGRDGRELVMTTATGWIEVEGTTYCPTCAHRGAVVERADRTDTPWTALTAEECAASGCVDDQGTPLPACCDTCGTDYESPSHHLQGGNTP